jgi:hypothetical protein
MHHDQAEFIAKSLGGARKAGEDWSCRCPAHDDDRASLSLKQKPNGKLLVHCHAGCTQEDVIAELKTRGHWLNGDSTHPNTGSGVQINYETLGQKPTPVIPRITDIYPYVNESGALQFECVRMEPKDFRQRRPNGHGGYVWSIKDTPRVLYNLPTLLQAIRDGERVYIVEGEKDVETARRLGLVATCNPMGADNGTGNKWLKEWGPYFANAEVVIIPDQDAAGDRHARWVYSTIKEHAFKVYVAQPAAGKDLSDWVAAGADVAAIESSLQDAATSFDVSSDEKNATHDKPPHTNIFLPVGDLVENIQEVNWLIEGFVEQDSLTLIYGAPASGKSLLSMDWACSVATGTPWLGQHDVQRGGAYYVAAEGLNGLSRRFRAWSVGRKVSLKGAPLYQSTRGIQVLDRNSVLAMVADIEAIEAQTGVPPKLVVIDTVARSFGAGDENSTEDMSNFIQHLDELIRKRWNLTVLLVHHSGHVEGRARGSSALRAAVDSEYGVSNDCGNVLIHCTKMKEAEVPADVYLKIRGIDLGIIDRKGRPVTGGLLVEPDDFINQKIAEDKDGSAILAHEVLAVISKEWLSLSKLNTVFNCTQRQSRNILSALTKFGFIDKKAVTPAGIDALSRTGHQIMQTHKPIWKRDESEKDAT